MEKDKKYYSNFGLKAGIEIHQQLDTSKLFCSCQSLLRTEEPDIIVRRKLRAVKGEIGEIDVAATFEVAREREFIYEAYFDSTCFVELDEEPPHMINEEALGIALQICLLLNAKPFEITQVMRKTVVDGSNPSGFQRTLLLARDGWIETEDGKIEIASISLEEDAARIIKGGEKEVVYRLDRLGIPLVEISTKPQIKTPEQAREVALAIGEVLRACKIKRGIGTIRQDINLSIEKGARSEIKGVQEPTLIPKVIEKEVERQIALIQHNKKVDASVRKALPNGETVFLRPLPGAARMYPETDLPLIKISRRMLEEIRKSLPKLKQEIKAELKGKGLHQEMIKLLLEENKIEEFKALSKIKINPNLIVKTLVLWPREIAAHEKVSEEKIREKLSLDVAETILEAVSKGKINEEDVKSIMLDIAKGENVEKALKKEKIPAEIIEREIQQLLKTKPGLGINAYIGLIMQKFDKKVSGREIAEILKKYIKQV